MLGKFSLTVLLVFVIIGCQTKYQPKGGQTQDEDFVPINHLKIWQTGSGRSHELITRRTHLVSYVFFLQNRWTKEHEASINRLKYMAKEMLDDETSQLVSFVGIDGNGKLIDSNAVYLLKKLFPEVYTKYDITEVNVIVVTSLLRHPLQFKAKLESFDDSNLASIDYSTYYDTPSKQYDLQSVLLFGKAANSNCIEDEISLHISMAAIEKTDNTYEQKCFFIESLDSVTEDFSSNSQLEDWVKLIKDMSNIFKWN